MLTQIEQEIKKSMIAKQPFRLGVLRMVKADLINNSKTAKPKDEMSVVNDYLKKLQKVKEINIANSIDSTDLDIEMSIVAEFLPIPVTEEELESFIVELLQTESNIGVLIKTTKAKFPNADGKVINQIITRNK